MSDITCDICGYSHDTAVYVCVDGVARCKKCRHLLQWGKWLNDDEAYARKKAGDFNPDYEPDAAASIAALQERAS